MQNLKELSTKFKTEVTALLEKRNYSIKSKSKAEKRFVIDFRSHAWTNHCEYGDGYEMISILLDDNNLLPETFFNHNWRMKIDDLSPKKLSDNKTWKAVFPLMTDFTHTKVGIGELILPLIVNGWVYEKTGKKGDGTVNGGKRELKKNGASLKPIEDSQGRYIDDLNKTLFEGHRAGPAKKFPLHVRWMETKEDPRSIYLAFFSNLYPGRDVIPLVDKLMIDFSSWDHWSYTLGQQVLEWYKQTDGWDSLVIINDKTGEIANIADVSDEMIKPLKLKFDWKSFRGKDTQALPDGYVNVGLAK